MLRYHLLHHQPWSLYALWQEQSNKPLHYLAKSFRKDIGDGYDTLRDNLKGYLELGMSPVSNIAWLDKEDSIGNTLAHNQGKGHATCQLKCCASRFTRARI